MDAIWKNPSDTFSLKENHVDIWRIFISEQINFLDDYNELLSKKEIKKSKAYAFEKDKNSYLIRHAALRQLIGSYLNIEPNSIKFDTQGNDKPILKTPQTLKFNLSHSGDMILIAISPNLEVGIDVEMNKPLPDFANIVKSYFSKNEIDKLFNLSETDQLEGFYNCWTRKEAYIKATGQGLSTPLDQFSVSLIPGAAPKLTRVEWDPDELDNWTMFHIDAAQDYIGALCAAGESIQTSWWNFQVES